MLRPRLVQFVALLCCLVLIGIAGLRIPAINVGRQQLNIMGSTSPLKNTPPEYVFWVQALGAFRGLIADIAFIRAEQLKTQGRFFDSWQLHKWICALQPHFVLVWEYASWNMAWNISVKTFTPQERWHWVYAGVKLLRDQGIPQNERAINLYKQLAWIFNSKMSETTDDFHYAYKANWAWRMHLLLGAPPNPLAVVDPTTLADEVRTPEDISKLEQAGLQTQQQVDDGRRAVAEAIAEATGEEYQEPEDIEGPPVQAAREASEFAQISTYRLAQQAVRKPIEAISKTPTTLAGLAAEYPETANMVSQLRTLGVNIGDDRLTEEAYWSPSGLAFTFFQPYRSLIDTNSTLLDVMKQKAEDQQELTRAERIGQALGLDGSNPAGPALVRFLQRKVLTEVYKLDPAHMVFLIDEFGPIDWRAVDAQSLYWTTMGLIAGGESVHEYLHDKTNTARILFFSLRNLCLRNRITFEPYPDPENIHLSYLNFGYDLNFVEPMNRAYVKYGRLFGPSDNVGGTGPSDSTGGGTDEMFRVGHINLLTEAIRLLYLSGRETDAGHYYEYLRTTYPLAMGGGPNELFANNLHDFVMETFFEGITSPSQREIMLIIDALLTKSYGELADGNLTAYARLVRQCGELRTDYMRDKGGTLSQRTRIPSIEFLQIDAFGRWFARPTLSHVQTLNKIRLWRRAPLFLRQSVYDSLTPWFKAECEARDFDLARSFPEPADMATFRAQHPERYQKTSEGGAETMIEQSR